MWQQTIRLEAAHIRSSIDEQYNTMRHNTEYL